MKDDPGYRYDAVLCKVLLNGVEILDCFTADEEERAAYCYSSDRAGHFITDGDKLATEIRLGDVRIITPDNSQLTK